MKLGDLQVEIRPRTPGQTVSLATRLLQHRPGAVIAAWVSSSVSLVAVALWIASRSAPPAVWSWLFLLILGPLFTAPMIVTAGRLVFSPEVTAGQVVRATLGRLLPFTLLFILYRLLIFVGFNLLIIPGLYLWRNSWFLGPIALLEGAPFAASFHRGRAFALGFSGHVLSHAAHVGAMLVYLTVSTASVLHFSVELLGTSIAAVGRLTLLEGYFEGLLILGFSMALPFAALIWFFVYLDLRTRKEGWDLELAFRARAARPQGDRPVQPEEGRHVV